MMCLMIPNRQDFTGVMDGWDLAVKMGYGCLGYQNILLLAFEPMDI